MFKSSFPFLAVLILFSSLYSQSVDSVKNIISYELSPAIISATRYPEEIMEIPYAVTLIGNKQLENIKGYGLDEIMMHVPGVLAQSRSGNQDVRIIIRGYGARGAGDRSNSGTSRGIRIMIDGFPETEPDGRTSFDNIDPSLYESTEIIRSNSSALWGNASGGIVNFFTAPFFENNFYKAGYTNGSFGFNKFSFQTGLNMGSGKFFISASNNNFEGWRKHSSSKRTVINAGLISELTEDTKLGVYLLASGNLFHIPGPLTQKQFDVDASQSNPTYAKRDERRYNRLGRIGVTFEHKIANGNFLSAMTYVNPKYLQRSERNTYRDFTRYHIGGNLLYRNEMNFSESKNNFILGFDEAYQDGSILFYSLSPNNSRGNTLTADKREGANTFGLFFQDEFNYKKISIIAGGRYDKVVYYSEDFLQPEFGLQDKSFERFTPKAGITYQISSAQSIYANIGGGVEVPAGNETDPAGTYGQDSVYLLNPLLEPIISTTYELGTKHFIFFNDSPISSVDYNVALYYLNIKNDIVPYRGGRFYFTAGKTHRTGIELGFNINSEYGLSLNSSLTYSINKYDEYKIDSAHYQRPGKFADLKGNEVAGIPTNFYNVGLTYNPSWLQDFYVNVQMNSVGKYFTDDANTIQVPSYNIFNVSFGTHEGIRIGAVTMKGFVSINNLTDKKYVSSAFINPDIVNNEAVYLEPGLPKNYTFSLGIRL